MKILGFDCVMTGNTNDSADILLDIKLDSETKTELEVTSEEQRLFVRYAYSGDFRYMFVVAENGDTGNLPERFHDEVFAYIKENDLQSKVREEIQDILSK